MGLISFSCTDLDEEIFSEITTDNYYQNSEKKYPLIIFLHGFGDDLNGWQCNTPIIKMCEENGVAACFINGENKWYLNMGPIDDFYSLIERDVTDFLYGNFKCLSKDMPLIIAGVSMGGYGALYHYLKNTVLRFLLQLSLIS